MQILSELSIMTNMQNIRKCVEDHIEGKLLKLAFFCVMTYLYYVFFTFLVVVTTEYISFHPVWTSGRAAGQPLVIQGTIFYPEETIMYPKSRPYKFTDQCEQKVCDYCKSL